MWNTWAAGLMWHCHNAVSAGVFMCPRPWPGERWQRLKKSLKTNRPVPRAGDLEKFEIGQVPFLFRQKALTTVSGHTLRPGGLTLTRDAVDVCCFDGTDFVLDAGCGNGATLRYLREEFGIMGVGTDLYPDIPGKIQRAHGKTIGTSGSDPGFIQSRLPALPFKSRVFSGIFSECVLSLIPDKKTCLEEFFRLLKTNGKLVITDVYLPQMFKASVSCCQNKTQPVSCMDGAISLLDLIGLVESVGFQVDIIEDHTRLLKQLAGQMVFEHGSLNNFWGKVTGSICDNSLTRACRTGALRPGYCMLIAGKYE